MQALKLMLSQNKTLQQRGEIPKDLLELEKESEGLMRELGNNKDFLINV